MNRDSDVEAEQIDLEMAEELVTSPRRDEALRHRLGWDGSKPFWLPILFTGIVGFILIVVFTLFLKSHEKAVDVELNTIELKLNMLEGRVSQLEKEVPDLQAAVMKAQEPQGGLTQRLNRLSAQVNQLEERMPSASVGADVSPAGQPILVDQNKGRYHKVRRGETLYGIAKAYGISVDELYRLNDISPNQVGDISTGRSLLVSPQD